MAKKSRSSRRSSSRKMKHTRKDKTHKRKTHRPKTHKRKTHRRRGGSTHSGAPVNYHLSGDWSSRMSLGQGADYFKYHEGQHGGGALGMGKFPDVVLDQGLPQALRGPAHIGGIDKAFSDIAGLKDQAGGKRKRSSKHRKSHGKKQTHTKKHRRSHTRSHKRSHKRSSGGSLGHAPFPSPGMLLSSPHQYAQAGLNPEWKTDVAFTDAKMRETH